MMKSNRELWARFKEYYQEYPTLGLSLDISRMNFAEDFFARMEPQMQEAFAAMAKLEKGALANPDENRMVGHYWLRYPAMAPTREMRQEIESTIQAVQEFSTAVHQGAIQGAQGSFAHILVIGIGGSALGPQLVSAALGLPSHDKLAVHFFDNTDPDGMEVVLDQLQGKLGKTLCLVISKSGGTKETRNGMLVAEAAYTRAKLSFAEHAVAVTGGGSALHQHAQKQGWLKTFPMWDWVGGRTSEMSAVGLLPAALQGIDILSMLAGAKACDEVTRRPETLTNPAALLALMWHHAGNGKGLKDMVILPYKDRLALFSRYLQQLIMESIGKEQDLAGRTVHQGIAVYGNKGSTDQHAYIQQLRDGLNNFFVTFIEVLADQSGVPVQVESEVTSGDYLSGFLLGTREALFEKDRESITLTINQITPFTIGVLIALYERAVGYYASLINVNAYHQPGVEAGKKAAESILRLQSSIIELLKQHKGNQFTVEQLATAIGAHDRQETVFKVCEHLSANSGKGIVKKPGSDPFSATYELKKSDV